MSEGRTGTGGTSAPTVLRMILGRRLQERRQGAGASLEDAARALRVTSLTIRRLEKAEVALKPLYVEYGVGGYYRRFTVGDMIDREGIKAQLKNGVLVAGSEPRADGCAVGI